MWLNLFILAVVQATVSAEVSLSDRPIIATVSAEVLLNDRPIIGILAQELSEYMSNKYPGDHNSYIAASYVKFVEGAGARVVPIKINQTDEYYENLVNSTNGVLFPGGGAYFDTPKGYGDAAWTLYNLAVRRNEAGDYFPVWGTCLGFELLTYLAAGRVYILSDCEAEDVPMPLEFKPNYLSSKLFGPLAQNRHMISILTEQNVTANFHHKCVTEKNLTDAGLTRDWQVLSVNKDVNGLEFVSSFEHKRYPIYGVQFHPEKNAYEWKPTNTNPHFADAIIAEQYFANFFVGEARKSQHHFPTVEEETDALIYNYQPQYTGRNKSSFEQIYFF